MIKAASAGNFLISGNFDVRHAGTSPAGGQEGRQSRRGGNRTVRTDLKAVQGLSFPGR